MELHNPALSYPRPAAPRRHWSLDDIPWRAIRHDAVAQTQAFFYLVTAASLMESATDLYTENLIDYFADDEEVTTWLEHYWLPEELQHGRALRRYVEVAWPEFDWEPAQRRFVEEFRPYCDTSLEPTRSQEMASRCVVETGTASYYRTLSRASPDPVLALLTRHIAEDEVRHYKHFYRYFRKYRDAETPSRAAILPALWRRLRDDRRRRQLYRPQACLQRPSSRQTVRYRGVSPRAPRVPRPRPRPLSARDERADAVEAARSRSANSARWRCRSITALARRVVP